MRITKVKFHSLRLTVPRSRILVNNPRVRFIFRPDSIYMHEVFRKIREMLDVNFRVWSTLSTAYLEVLHGMIYVRIPNINARDVARMLTYFDMYNVPIKNYNQDEINPVKYWRKSRKQ